MGVLVFRCLFGAAPGRTPRPGRRSATASVAVACAVAAFATNRASPVADGAGGLQPEQSPVTALLLTGWQKWQLSRYDAMSRGLVDDDPPYPYLKDWVHRQAPPFAGNPPRARPTCIVRFIAAMSAHALETYSHPYPAPSP